jgi:hypothetical protein
MPKNKGKYLKLKMRVVASIPATPTNYKRQTRPLTASGCATGFLFLRIISGLRRD